jgi:ribosomal protein L29
MAILKAKDIKNMKEEEKKNKIKELKLELTKAYAKSGQGTSSKIKEIKKTIARLLTKN